VNDEEILSQIAYLDDFQSNALGKDFVEPPDDFSKLIKAMIQLEIAKQSHWWTSEEFSSRVASLESRLEKLMHETACRKERPVVQYVVGMPRRDLEVFRDRRVVKLPMAITIFYALGLACSLFFAVLLSLSATGINLMHPFLSLLGLTGGLGWLTTAWTDLLLWKREVVQVNETTPSERHAAA